MLTLQEEPRVRTPKFSGRDGPRSVVPAPKFPPAFSALVLELIMIVGTTVSIAIGLTRAPAVLAFPAVSVKVPAATETFPASVESAAGVKTAE